MMNNMLYSVKEQLWYISHSTQCIRHSVLLRGLASIYADWPMLLHTTSDYKYFKDMPFYSALFYYGLMPI